MKTITITCKVDLPADATYDEAVAWVKFELGQVGGMPACDLSEHDLEAYDVQIDWS